MYNCWFVYCIYFVLCPPCSVYNLLYVGICWWLNVLTHIIKTLTSEGIYGVNVQSLALWRMYVRFYSLLLTVTAEMDTYTSIKGRVVALLSYVFVFYFVLM